MTECRVGKFFACLMAIVFPVSMIAAETSGAMLYASNGAVVNGASVQRSGAVFAGDKLQVPANSTVTVTAPGSQIVVPAGSAITFQGTSVSLGQGSGVAVVTTKGMAVKIDKLTIAPAGNNANFQVARAGGEVLVAAKHGLVSISDGSATRTVEEGKTESVKDPAPPQGQGGNAAGAGGAGVSTALAVLIGVAAAAAGAAIGVVATREPASPAHP